MISLTPRRSTRALQCIAFVLVLVLASGALAAPPSGGSARPHTAPMFGRPGNVGGRNSARANRLRRGVARRTRGHAGSLER